MSYYNIHFYKESRGMNPYTETAKKWGLFIVVMFLLILLGYLFFYDSVQREVKNTSRCIREKNAAATGNIYSVFAKDANSNNAYKVTYNTTPGKEGYTIDCNCAPGDFANDFNAIKYYDFASRTAKEDAQKRCLCNSTLDMNTPMYTGHPSLVMFMNSGDTSLFTGSN